MTIILIIITAFLYYITVIDQMIFSELSFTIIEIQTGLKIPLWLIPIFLIFFLHMSKLLTRKREEEPPPRRSVLPRQTGLSSIENPTERAELSAEWKNNILDQIQTLNLPSGASIETDPFKGVPLCLKLERTTPQATRRALEEFARFLSQIPIPPRIFIKLLDTIKTEVPPKNLVRGAFQKHLNISELAIVSQMDGIDIRFHKPDSLWENDPNLGFDIASQDFT